jgi:hypothetical protein
MIPARQLTPQEYVQEFPPGGRPSFPSSNNDTDRSNGHGSARPPRNIINDVPLSAKSFLIYKHAVLEAHEGDGTFPIPQSDEFQHLHELKSLEAVVKETDSGKSVFSHMLVSPADVRKVFGDDFMKKMEVIQNLVRHNMFNLRLITRSSARESSRSRLKSILG